MASELIWPYILKNDNPTSSGYLEWAKKQTDKIYKLKFEQAIICFRIGVRTNHPLLRNAARRQFAPIWTKATLLAILQEIRGLSNAEEVVDEENVDEELVNQEMA
ncbi:hypothetical protein C2G38_2050596 [Gigaspora rosea]|uniref:Uncharacterized protein n=1 Tax=Gigaspora rosea TaxID=44941 RepID=A0A397TUJ2_9GLOM|nr:hypothetical protein C2G38_2050596 [Gigaspora rosea]